MPELNPTKRWLTWTAYATSLMTPTTALCLSIRLSMFKLRETGDWDLFLGPPERARAETGGADHWVLKRRELPGFAIVNEKKRPHPWDTHHQFSIKTLLSQRPRTRSAAARQLECATPTDEILSRINTFSLGPFRSNVTFGKNFLRSSLRAAS